MKKHVASLLFVLVVLVLLTSSAVSDPTMACAPTAKQWRAVLRRNRPPRAEGKLNGSGGVVRPPEKECIQPLCSTKAQQQPKAIRLRCRRRTLR